MPDSVPITVGAGASVYTDEVATNLTGTVAKAASTAVTGTGTLFTQEIKVGQIIRIPGGTATEDRQVAAITSDTSITVSAAFTTTATGQVGQRIDHAQVVKLAIGVDGSPSFVPGDATFGLDVDVNRLPRAATSARTQITATTTEGVLLAANTNRLGAIITNDASAVLYVGLGTVTVSATDHTARLQRYDYYELPFNWTGQIRGLWSLASGDGGARITEVSV